ncbi:hypothetical protein AAY473_037122 [Plecturocebus cupreus]
MKRTPRKRQAQTYVCRDNRRAQRDFKQSAARPRKTTRHVPGSKKSHPQLELQPDARRSTRPSVEKAHRGWHSSWPATVNASTLQPAATKSASRPPPQNRSGSSLQGTTCCDPNGCRLYSCTILAAGWPSLPAPQGARRPRAGRKGRTTSASEPATPSHVNASGPRLRLRYLKRPPLGVASPGKRSRRPGPARARALQCFRSPRLPLRLPELATSLRSAVESCSVARLDCSGVISAHCHFDSLQLCLLEMVFRSVTQARVQWCDHHSPVALTTWAQAGILSESGLIFSSSHYK